MFEKFIGLGWKISLEKESFSDFVYTNVLLGIFGNGDILFDAGRSVGLLLRLRRA